MDPLYAVVAAEGLDKAAAERIADDSREADVLPIQAVQAYRKGPWVLELAGVHLLLEEGATVDAVSWNLTPVGIGRLTYTFEWLFEQIPGELIFEVLWGEDPIDKLVSREELLRVVATGRLGGRTRYRVRKA
ncbi:MAG TPA: hypothetical protein VD769_06890 [Gaiellaceae bacterium]|nr:hypothetical protein [Gaiellaceae bacterium]